MRNKDSNSTPARNSHWLIRLVLLTWHRVWADYWGQFKDDPVEFTCYSGELVGAMAKYQWHSERIKFYSQNK